MHYLILVWPNRKEEKKTEVYCTEYGILLIPYNELFIKTQGRYLEYFFFR